MCRIVVRMGPRPLLEEATTKKLHAKFFAENSVLELAKLNDYEIGKKGRVAEPMYLLRRALPTTSQ